MKLNLTDTILLALMVAVLMMGVHQIYVISQDEGFKVGVLKSYWIFMILFVLMAIYQGRKNKALKEKMAEPGGKAIKEKGNKHKKQ